MGNKKVSWGDRGDKVDRVGKSWARVLNLRSNGKTGNRQPVTCNLQPGTVTNDLKAKN
jgi:hypothetical protein